MALAKELSSHGLPEIRDALAGAITPSGRRLARGPKEFRSEGDSRSTWNLGDYARGSEMFSAL